MRSLATTAALLAATVLVSAPASAQVKLGGGGVEVMAPQNSAAVAPATVDAGSVTIRDPRNRRAVIAGRFSGAAPKRTSM